MKSGPDIARIAALIGDPARANMLAALMDGRALTAGELAREAGVTAQTASAHLARLEAGGLIRIRAQGRHRYAALASAEAAQTLEALMGLASRAGHMRVRPGPRDPELRAARVCYDHLAGEAGVRMLDSLLARDLLRREGEALAPGPGLGAFLDDLGVVPAATRAPLCRECLDWSARRPHLAGRLGRAFLARIEAQGWARRRAGSRAVDFTRAGRAAFEAAFPLDGG